MTSLWEANLATALRAAGLTDVATREVEATKEYCNHVAGAIAISFLGGQISGLAADAAINHLYPLMLECSESPKEAWRVYLAFDAGEHHPDQPAAADDDVTRQILLGQKGGA